MQNKLHTLLYNNNYDHIDIASHAFLTLPPVIQRALLDQSRVVLVANNPSISTDQLDNLLQPTDMLVLFNNFINADFFTSHPVARLLPKLLSFRQIGDSLLHFGMPPRSNNIAAIDTMASQAPLGILLGNTPYQFPIVGDDPSPNDDPITPSRILEIPQGLNALLRDDYYCRVLSDQNRVVADYPVFTDIHSSAPTSGFLMYRLLLAARKHVQQLQPYKAPLQLVMLGFNDDNKTAHFWQGHNWKFERQELAEPAHGVAVIRQY